MRQLDPSKKLDLAKAIYDCLISPNVSDSNFEAANLVDTTSRQASALFQIAENLQETGEAHSRAIYSLAKSITPNAAAGHDASGGTVLSLTEAVMGITAGLYRVAEAIEYLAEFSTKEQQQ